MIVSHTFIISYISICIILIVLIGLVYYMKRKSEDQILSYDNLYPLIANIKNPYSNF